MNSKIANAAVLITVITFLSKLTGFVREIILAAVYGTTVNSDALIMSQSIIGVFTNIIFAALGASFIPILSDYLVDKSKNETAKFINVVYTITSILSFIVCVFGILFANQIAEVFAPNFSPEAHKLTTELLRIMFPTILLTAIVTLNNAKLQNHNSFLVPSAIGFPVNFIVIFAMFFFSEPYGILGVSVAILIGSLLQPLLQLPYTRKLGYPIRFVIDFKDEGLRRMGTLIVPILIGSGIQQINIIVDRVLASGLAEGSIAALTFSNRLGLFITGILSATVVSIYYTSMSNYFSAGRDELFKKLLRNTINISVILMIPASVGFMVLRMPIIKLIFERGMFDNSASKMTAFALLYYTVGLIGYLLRDVLNRAFYALKDTKTVMINGILAVIINIIASIVLVRYMDLGGLALGTSISSVVGSILLIISLYRKIGDFGLRNIILTSLKVIAASLVMGTTSYYVYNGIFSIYSSNMIALFISVFLGVMIYGAIIYMLRINEFKSLLQVVLVRFRKKRQEAD